MPPPPIPPPPLPPPPIPPPPPMPPPPMPPPQPCMRGSYLPQLRLVRRAARYATAGTNERPICALFTFPAPHCGLPFRVTGVRIWILSARARRVLRSMSAIYVQQHRRLAL
eukprot:547776-Prymnesium_polylepis.1